MGEQTNGYRDSDHVIPGFNLAIVDVDGQLSIDSAEWLLDEYQYLIYTTKRHTNKKNRFRLIFPMSHKLYLSKDDYKEFMRNFYAWLPFEVDSQTVDYARKWMTHPGMNKYHAGQLLDATLFIPKTKKSEERRVLIHTQQNHSNIERWFINNTQDGNRNNQLIRYGLMLVDSGMALTDIQDKVITFNSKLHNPLHELEIHKTIFKSLNTAIIKRDKKDGQ